MTREEIFAKDYITVEELMFLLGVAYQTACKKMRDIKRFNDRLKIKGKVHTQDYIEFYELKEKFENGKF